MYLILCRSIELALTAKICEPLGFILNSLALFDSDLNSVLEPLPSIAIEINVFPDKKTLSEVGPK